MFWILAAAAGVACCGALMVVAVRWKQLAIKWKLVALSVTIVLASLAASGWLSISRSRAVVIHQQDLTLQAVCAARKGQIESYFQLLRNQMLTFAGDRMVGDAVSQFSDAHDSLAADVAKQGVTPDRARQADRAYMDSQFRAKLTDAGQPYRGADAYVPAGDANVILHDLYLVRNPNPPGEKLRLDKPDLDCAHARVHARYHPVLRQYLEAFGYYDVFLFDLQGDVVYTVYKETDFGTNFVNGPYANSALGEVYRKAAAATQPGEVFYADYKPYEPSYGAPASFMAAPIFLDGKKVGVAAFQMPTDRITAIMNSSDGLGDTGDCYLVGGDLMMRSDSRFSEASTILQQRVDTPAAHAALEGKTEAIQQTDFKGREVLAVAMPVEIEGAKWCVVAEIAFDEVEAPAVALRSAILVVAAVVGVLAVLGAVGIAALLTRPIGPITRRAREIAAGNLAVEPLAVTTQDELGQVTESMNAMLQALREMVTGVTGSATEVAGAATQIAASSEQMAAGTREQTGQIQQVAAAVEEMASSVVEVSQNCTRASTQAQQASSTAAQGGKVVEKTVTDIRTIADIVSETSRVVDALGQRGAEIDRIIGVINEIADQTNLLALNAAIESARAGEHGRGFAVVADEVRKLAERTTHATEEVTESIHAIQSDTNSVVQRIADGSKAVETGVTQASAAGQTLTAIVTDAMDVAKMIQSIAAAAEQQSVTAGEITGNVEKISFVTDQTAQAASQSAAAAMQLSAKAEELRRLMSRFQLS